MARPTRARVAETARPWLSHYGPEAHAFEAGLATFTPPRFSEFFADAVAKYPDAPALSICLPTGSSATLTYRDLDRQSAALARYFREALDLQKGDVVAVQAPNCLGYLIAVFATLRAGLRLTNINPLYTADETRRQLRDCKARVLLATGLFPEVVEGAVPGTDVATVIELALTDGFAPAKRAVLDFVLRRIKKVARPLSNATCTLQDAIKAGASFETPLAQYALDRGPEDDAIYQYSGGTTGVSKGVRLTEAGLMTTVAQYAALAPELVQPKSRTMALALPVYHVFGLFCCLMGMKAGGHIVLAPSPRPLTNLKPLFEKFQPDMFPGVNTLFAKLMEEPWFQERSPQLEFTLAGAAALSPSVAKAWEAATGGEIMEGYGMTETTTLFAINPPGAANRKGTVGLPLPGCDLRVLDEAGCALPMGEVGELALAGPQLMAGYLGRDAATQDAFVDGYMRTGDMGYVDADGYIHIVDRLKDMILVGGFNVFPVEVEAALMEHRGVLEAGVVAGADAHGGEDVVAYIVRAEGSDICEADLRAFMDAKLTGYKRPRRYRFLEELPKSPIGKVLRKDLRALEAK